MCISKSEQARPFMILVPTSNIFLVFVYCRNVLTESARIARGNIQALSALSTDNFDALVFPGGFGAAKNLYVIIDCLKDKESNEFTLASSH